MVLRAYYGHRYATFRAHKNRWIVFSNFLRENGIRDTREVNKETIRSFAGKLKEKIMIGSMKQSYAVNLLSTVNVIMQLLREDSVMTVSPKELIGTRTRVRTVAPKGMDLDAVRAATDQMRKNGHVREALIILLAREFSMRKKECCLLHIKKALDEAKATGAISISRGTKGGRGRNIPRQYPVTPYGIKILEEAANFQRSHSCLIPPGLTLKQFAGKVDRGWRKVRDEFGLGKIHDLRAAGACQLYAETAGCSAPVCVECQPGPTKEKHHAAMDKVSEALGHGRRSSALAYVGSRRRS
jgi:hypothetical protein